MSPPNAPSGGIDTIGCVGLLLLALMLSAAVASFAAPKNDEAQAEGVALRSTPAATATATAVWLSPTAVPTDPPTAQPTLTATATATELPTATPTSTWTPMVVATLPPTFTPAAIWTSEPTFTATPVLLPTPFGPYSRTVRVPILMYHYISTPPEDADIYRVDLSVEPANFRAQMRYLVQNGFTAIDLYDLSLAITNKKQLPPKPVIITIDDGYLDAYTEAFPILQEFGLKATVFIITQFVDDRHPAYMDWGMIREMAAAGHRMEPHSKTHLNMDGRNRDFLIYQALGSQQTLAHHIGYTPRYFAYPGGRYDETTLEVMAELDFWGAVTTRGGRWHGFNDRFEWTRMRVRHTTTLPEFADLVN
jgi:peptidoglycan/xylan/chitin deacetylase (PgdA/CDA1 family)